MPRICNPTGRKSHSVGQYAVGLNRTSQVVLTSDLRGLDDKTHPLVDRGLAGCFQVCLDGKGCTAYSSSGSRGGGEGPWGLDFWIPPLVHDVGFLTLGLKMDPHAPLLHGDLISWTLPPFPKSCARPCILHTDIIQRTRV